MITRSSPIGPQTAGAGLRGGGGAGRGAAGGRDPRHPRRGGGRGPRGGALRGRGQQVRHRGDSLPRQVTTSLTSVVSAANIVWSLEEC